ncbi:MAG: glycosyltransferase family 39 protein [Patescibacteria group bacterium]|nr:glycosyltransferase family 39 protein [Patescibacteria group bacterium]
MSSVQRWFFYALLMVGAFLLLFKLGSAPLQDYDEATFAEVTHEAVGGNILTLTYLGVPYLNKPPLFFWLADLSVRAFGENEFALRFPSAFAGLGLIATTIALGDLLGGISAGLLAGGILATTAPLIETSRQMRVDPLVTLCIILSTYGFVRGMKDKRWFLLFGVALGCAILAKSVIAVFALFAVCAYAVALKRFDWAKEKFFWLGILLCIAVALPWHLYELMRFGSSFFDQYLSYNVSTRFTEALFSSVTNTIYARYFFAFGAPWSEIWALSVLCLLVFWKRIPQIHRPAITASTVTVFAIGAVFFLAKTKAITYLLPLYPFIALSLGLWGAMLLRSNATRNVMKVGAIIVFLTGTVLTIWNGYHLNPYYSASDELAREEKAAAEILAQEHPYDWYSFKDSEVLSIVYYGGLRYPIPVMPSLSLPRGASVLLYGTSYSELVADYPKTAWTVLFKGSQILLLRAS